MTPDPLDSILKQWQQDSIIDTTNPGEEIIRVPVIHAYYVQQQSLHALCAKRAHMQWLDLRKIKWEYYNGRLSESELKEYGWPPFKFLLKTDITIYMDADSDLQRLRAKKELHDEVVTVCQAILKEINNRTWQLREFMTHERFTLGAH